MNGTAVTLEEVLEIAKDCNIEFKPGDIFFMRIGFVKTWESISMDQKKEYRTQTQAHKHKHTGLIQSEEVARFVWNNRIVAVAGDGVSTSSENENVGTISTDSLSSIIGQLRGKAEQKQRVVDAQLLPCRLGSANW